MSDVLVGVIAVVVGLLFCLRGQRALRFVLALWGGFIGFWLGAGIANTVTDEGFLAGPIGWVSALVGALVFSGLAYAFYALAVLISLGSIGFGLGTALGAALRWDSVSVTVAAVLLAVVLALVGLLLNLPRLLLVVLSAVAGAAVVVGGVALVLGAVDTAALAASGSTPVSLEGPWWGIGYAALVIVSIIVQSRSGAQGSARSRWS